MSEGQGGCTSTTCIQVGCKWEYVCKEPGAADTPILVGNVLKKLGMRRLMTYCIR